MQTSKKLRKLYVVSRFYPKPSRKPTTTNSNELISTIKAESLDENSTPASALTDLFRRRERAHATLQEIQDKHPHESNFIYRCPTSQVSNCSILCTRVENIGES